MTLLPLNPDELLSTTRSVRLRLDLERPVERELVEARAALPVGQVDQRLAVGEQQVEG